MTKNKNSTRYYSQEQEQEVAKIINGYCQPNSGAGLFNKGDVINKEASILVECKCSTKEKDSFSIKKEWFIKNKNEMNQVGCSNHCLAFNFGNPKENFFIIDKKLMTFLIESLKENERG